MIDARSTLLKITRLARRVPTSWRGCPRGQGRSQGWGSVDIRQCTGRLCFSLVYTANMATDIGSCRDFLRSISLFGGLDDASLERVEGMLIEHTLAPGAIVCSEGEQGRSMYVVASGEVEVRGMNSRGVQVPIVRLGQGELFGEMTLIEIQPRSATVVAMELCTLYALSQKDFHKLYVEDLNAYILTLQNIARQISRRLRQADNRICELVTSSTISDRTPVVTAVSTLPGPSTRA